MSILRYTASLDNTITNAFEENLTIRGTGSNMGAADILEVFSIRDQASTDSSELSRVLIQFPTSSIVSDRALGILPASGSVTWKLKLYNAPHFTTTPRSFDLQVSAVSASWEEGIGLDMEQYTDLTKDGIGSNWINRTGDNIAEITKFDFTSDTRSSYGSGDPVSKYLKLYNRSILYNVWFNDGTNDTTGSSGNWIEVDISSVSDTAAAVAAAFKSALSGSNGFDGSIDGSDDTIVYITASAGKASAHAVGKDMTDPAITIITSGSNATTWTTAGGDYHASPIMSQSFDTGFENLDIDVSHIVEEWLKPTKANYGFGIRLTDTYESAETSYYTKKFFGRGTEFFFKRPVLEAQFEDTKKDDRGNFFVSSSLLLKNTNTLFFHNRFRGQLRDILDDQTKVPTLKFYYSSGSVPEGNARNFLNSENSEVSELNAVRVSKGIYKAEVAVTGGIITDNYPYLIDVWSFEGEEVLTGSVITPKTFRPETYEESNNLVLSMTNLKPEYGKNDLTKLRLYAREKNWSPNIYTVAKSKPENKLIISGSYKVIRVTDNLTVVDYGTGSIKYTELSYDENGNYFEFNMDMLEPGYQYGFKFAVYDDYTKNYLEQPYIFKFRVS